MVDLQHGQSNLLCYNILLLFKFFLTMRSRAQLSLKLNELRLSVIFPEWEITVIPLFLCHCLKQLLLVSCRVLCRPGLSDGTLNTTQQYDQSGPLRSPGAPLAPHRGSFVVVTAALLMTSPFFYLYQRRDDHWWNSTHFLEVYSCNFIFIAFFNILSIGSRSHRK